MGEKLEQLKQQYSEKLAQKMKLRQKSEDMELKLDRAGKLVSGLAAERERWEETIKVALSRQQGGPQCSEAGVPWDTLGPPSPHEPPL